MNQELHGRHYRRKGIVGVQSVAAVERQKNFNPHVHALLGHPALDMTAADYRPLMRHMKQFCEDEWGFSRWDLVTVEDDARRYVIDYAAKTGELYVSAKLEEMHRGQADLLGG